MKIMLFVECDTFDVDAVVSDVQKEKWRKKFIDFYDRPVKLLVLSDKLTIADLTKEPQDHGYETRDY